MHPEKSALANRACIGYDARSSEHIDAARVSEVNSVNEPFRNRIVEIDNARIGRLPRQRAIAVHAR